MQAVNEIREDRALTEEEVLSLYTSVGWSAYTRDIGSLMRAISSSTWVASARSDNQLLGLVRVLSDEVSIAWIQDLLVRPEHQRLGIGRRLAQAALDRFAGVRTIALLTDSEPRQSAFYRSMGLLEIAEHPPNTLRCFLRAR